MDLYDGANALVSAYVAGCSEEQIEQIKEGIKPLWKNTAVKLAEKQLRDWNKSGRRYSWCVALLPVKKNN